MAITIGTPATGNGGTINNSIVPFDYTVPADTDFLVVGILGQFQGGSGLYDTADLDGVDMTRLFEFSPNTRAITIFGLVAPAEGAGTVNIHYTYSVGHDTAPHIFAVDLQGDFYSVERSRGSTQGSEDDNPSFEYTVSATAGVVFDMFIANSAATPAAGQTAIYNNVDAAFYRAGASYETHAGSNPTLSYTGETSAVYAGVEVIESGAPPIARPIYT